MLLLMAITAAGCSHGLPSDRTAESTTSSTGSPYTTTSTDAFDPAPAPTTTTTTAPPPPLLDQSGSGISSTAQFTVPVGAREWDLVWSYSCTGVQGPVGNFIVNVKGYGGSAQTTDPGTNQIGASGNGTEHYFDAGTFNLEVNSECSWTVKVVWLPR